MKLLALAGMLVAVGCSRTGGVEGDAYLRMQNGDVKPMAAMWVYFAPGDRATTLARRTLAFCRQVQPQMDRLGDSVTFYNRVVQIQSQSLGESAELASATLRLFADSLHLLRVENAPTVARYRKAAVTDSAMTDMHGHYRFSQLPAGDGMIWADIDVGPHTYDWVRQVAVPRGATFTADLDNQRVAEGGVCPS